MDIPYTAPTMPSMPAIIPSAEPACVPGRDFLTRCIHVAGDLAPVAANSARTSPPTRPPIMGSVRHAFPFPVQSDRTQKKRVKH